MASHYVGLAQGIEGFKYSDFTFDTSATAGKIELRVLDGAGLRVIDAQKALEAFERLINNPQLLVLSGLDLTT